jgi:ethanolamine utilization microcompartment shell protein EutS
MFTKQISRDTNMSTGNTNTTIDSKFIHDFTPGRQVGVGNLSGNIEKYVLPFLFQLTLRPGLCFVDFLLVVRIFYEWIRHILVYHPPSSKFIHDFTPGRQVGVGNLSGNIEKWKDIGANEYIIDVIENGYKIPFLHIPDSIALDNNKSARDNGSLHFIF